jgi:type II secretory pathway component PulK
VRVRRTSERGASLLVVVLVISLLMGIGVFAARSAHLATTSSGHERQMTQARYVAEYGLLIAVAKLSSQGAQSYVNQATNPSVAPGQNCYGQSLVKTPTCYKMFHREIQA